jgi:HPr kinase/phosphorylase
MSAEEPKVRGACVRVSDFLEHGRTSLHLSLVAGEAGRRNRIQEAAINRPGLAFSGFYHYFANRRVQVLGLAEHSFLSSLDAAERAKRLREFFSKKIPCVVVSRNRHVFPEIGGLADEFRVPVLRTRMVTKTFINAATIMMENLSAPRVNAQGTMVEIMGMGVLIEGKPGMGKSETALGLIKRGHALVSDDITTLRLDSSGKVIGAPVSVTRYHMEVRGVGIIHVPSLFGVAAVREEKKLDLVATLCEPGSCPDEERGGREKLTRVLLGVPIPQVLIRVAPGRDLVNLIETAALDHKLRRLGHDAAKELDDRLIRSMTGGMDASE